MIAIREIIAVIMIVIGLLFLVISAVGMLRLPDFYSRLHASGNSETLGMMLTLLGFVIYEGANLISFKLIFIFMFVFIGNPIGTHILSKAAYKTGEPVWTNKNNEENKEGGSN
ncbi:MAG: monovalent cation/H(+) antiporter subunit G [Firmicutes bacterium]|nr:monovalent cation/H(+) antiporter subunit G [Bacillota bacterium]